MYGNKSDDYIIFERRLYFKTMLSRILII